MACVTAVTAHGLSPRVKCKSSSGGTEQNHLSEQIPAAAAALQHSLPTQQAATPGADKQISQSSTMCAIVWEQSRVADSRLERDFHCQSHTSNTELLIDLSAFVKRHS